MNKIARVVAKIIAVIAQWLVCAFFFVLTIASAGGAFKFHAAKLDIANVSVAVAAMAAVTVFCNAMLHAGSRQLPIKSA